MARHPYSLRNLVGRRITGLARVFYEHGGQILSDDGALELALDGETLLFDADSDGESLRMRERAWKDPFEEPLSEANQRYLDEHGRWRHVDCSQTRPYADLCGHTVIHACALVNEFKKVAGMRISVSTRNMWFVVQGDESHVCWAQPIGFSESEVLGIGGTGPGT